MVTEHEVVPLVVKLQPASMERVQPATPAPAQYWFNSRPRDFYLEGPHYFVRIGQGGVGLRQQIFNFGPNRRSKGRFIRRKIAVMLQGVRRRNIYHHVLLSLVRRNSKGTRLIKV
jgi:hypothetical protein